jgi:hypothetical protein
MVLRSVREVYNRFILSMVRIAHRGWVTISACVPISTSPPAARRGLRFGARAVSTRAPAVFVAITVARCVSLAVHGASAALIARRAVAVLSIAAHRLSTRVASVSALPVAREHVALAVACVVVRATALREPPKR